MNENIEKTALELALKFEDESEIPNRFKKRNSNRAVKTNNESQIERKFQQLRLDWEKTIESILTNCNDQNLAWRFIKNTPEYADSNIRDVTLNADFIAFIDFFVKRRDKDQCSDIELGNLCKLLSAFQLKIENTYKSE